MEKKSKQPKKITRMIFKKKKIRINGEKQLRHSEKLKKIM